MPSEWRMGFQRLQDGAELKKRLQDIAGPPHDEAAGLPVFDWTEETCEEVDGHFGQPDRWDFGWYTFI